jgi:hypothetical protein
MKKEKVILFLLINSSLLFAQVTLTTEGTTVNSSETGMWEGVNIARTQPTAFTFRNNSIKSLNSSGYMLQAGDESVLSSNNNLNGEIITGNKFIWNGTDQAQYITHGLFTGYNINAVIKYNYLNKAPMAIICKSNGMTNTSGGIAYNIVNKTGACAVNIKGMNGVLVYNNTFYSNEVTYSGETFPGTWRGLVEIYANNDEDGSPQSSGCKVKNNIFYTVNQIYNIAIYESGDLTGFESDYNVFYCESGTPLFNYLGTTKTFAQWQALGYDSHSVVVNPNFIDFTDFVPILRLDYGTDLGSAWLSGLSSTATWIPGASPAVVNQNGTWQVGARIYDVTSINPYYISSVTEDDTPAFLDMTYSSSLANIVPAVSAFNVEVNSIKRNVNSVTILGDNVRLTLASRVYYGDLITVDYTKPSINQLQTTSGGEAASIIAQPVVNNCINISPAVVLTSPESGSSLLAPADITITANATDVDGTISKVEFFDGSTKLGEKTTAPYSFTWTNVNPGNYILGAIATDNSNLTFSSSPVMVHVISNDNNVELINLFPNPNSGNFSIDILIPPKDEITIISIFNSSGKKVYDGKLLNSEITKQFNLDYLVSGIYILMITGKQILVAKKFIKI